MADSQSRKWQITINNPVDKGFTHEVIRAKLGEFKSLVYWCMADEVGENETYHTHVYMALSSATRFSTIKKRFQGGHFEMAKGTSQQNRDYVFKEGKWEKDRKVETHLSRTREEWGDLPVERQGERNDLADLYDMIKQGMSNYEILEACPQFMTIVDKIDRTREVVLTEKFKKEWRDVRCVYVHGKTRTGKTRSIMEKYGYDKVYRVSNYKNPFDGYQGQDVLLLDEFRSGIPFGDFLKIAEGYPLVFSCRYQDKTVCCTKVYVVSNECLSRQYPNVREEERTSWDAFIARFDSVIEFTGDGIKKESITEWASRLGFLPGFTPSRDTSNPFDSESKGCETVTETQLTV